MKKERFIKCPFCIDNEGEFINTTASKEIVEKVYELKELVMNMKSKKMLLNTLIYVLEVRLVRYPETEWLNKNRDRLRKAIDVIPDLDVFPSDMTEIKKSKLIIAAKLIELIES